jgi:hypothetical protein
MKLPEVIWKPQPGPQTDFLECPTAEIFFGGARGGGKTDSVLGKWLQHCDRWGARAKGIIVRRRLKQLEDMIARAKVLFIPLGGAYNDQKSTFAMPNGAILRFRYLERDSDAEEYIGHSYTFLGVEEIPNFPSPEPINKLRATLRSGEGVIPQMVATGNPGGPGHNWVKARYIDPAPKGYKILKESFKNPFDGTVMEIERVFIPSRLTDNMILMKSDPFYVARLQQQGSAQLVKAWLEGDWDVVIGSFFDCFDPRRHVLPVSVLESIPYIARRFRSFDWGSAKPFCVGWYVLSDGTWGLPPNALLKYREWYGAASPNVGLKMTAESVAEGIALREEGEHIGYGVADPALFIEDGGPSKAARMAARRVAFIKADNRRLSGWDQLRQLLLGEDGVPMLYFCENCEDTIRTLPTQQHDEGEPEDIDTEGEDHAADETRYAVMSRPLLKRTNLDEASLYPKLPGQLTFNELRDRVSARRRSAEAERIT